MLCMDTSPEIYSLRKKLEWSQEQMAEYLGIDRSTVSRIETAVQEPSGPVKRLLQQLAEREGSKASQEAA